MLEFVKKLIVLIKKNQERLNKIVESELKRLEIEKLTHEVSELKDANKLRKQFAKWSLCYVTFFTISVIFIIFLSATKARKFFWINFDNEFILDNSVLIALLTTFTAQIIGVVAFVMIYLFKNNGNKK